VAVGAAVTYSFLVTNTGNVTLANVTVNETAFSGTGTLSAVTCPAGAASLAPGASVTCTATYAVTQADLDAGQVVNTATATGTPPTGPTVTSPPSTATVTATPDPEVTVVKSASPSDAVSFTVGRLITYSFVMTNTGNVTLTNPTITEGTFTGSGTMSAPNCPATPTLAPGAQMTCTATYTVTQADVNAGSVTNDATATGTPPSGPPVDSPPSEVTIPSIQTPAIAIVKSANATTFTAAGQTVTYSFLVTNTGNVTLTNVTVDEGAFSGTGTMSAVTCPAGAASLLPGARVTCTATYVLTQADADAGTVTNVATATGTPPAGPPPVSPPSQVVVTITPDPSISLVKSASPTSPSAFIAGAVVTYSFVATNTGNVTLTSVTIIEGAFTGTGAMSAAVCPAGAASLAPGDQVICTATYTVTQADVDAGSITNSATVTGDPPSGATVVSPPSDVTIPAPADPELALVKSANVAKITAAGQTITYSFLVTNIGNVTLTNVGVVEGAFTGTGTLTAPQCPAAVASMVPGQQATCTATYVTTAADVSAGQVANAATSVGDPPTGQSIVSDPSDVQLPVLALAADPGGLAATGVTVPVPLIFAAFAAVMLGGLLVGIRRRRPAHRG
jgi:uncharacterized repeat protein (TIGR01451 family)